MDGQPAPDPRRIVIIGPCASGKTSLSTRLQRRGYRAYACGQEHSEIPDLWRHQAPDVVIGLHIDLETLRRRRSPTWPHDIYERQIARLRAGYARADLVIAADRIDQETVAERVIAWLRDHPERGAAGGS